MNVLVVSVTEAGRRLAQRLPYEVSHGDVGATVRARWNDVDAFVLVVAAGAATRVIGPLLADKRTDPAVVCVDEGGRWVVPLAGGHAGGANALATTVAELLGATAVITTASDSAQVPALDSLPGFTARGDVAGAMRRILDGGRVRLVSDLPSWPAPPTLPVDASGDVALRITDSAAPGAEDEVLLHPLSLVVGVGCSSGAHPGRIRALVYETLEAAELATDSVAVVATIDLRENEPGITALGYPMLTFTSETLAGIEVPTPSDVVAAAVGTPSVAEAAALLAAGPGAEIVVTKQKNEVATVAVARRAAPAGSVVVVGLGPGDARHRTPAADSAVRGAEVVVGYGPYVDQAGALLSAAQEVLSLPIGAEVDRARLALERAARGRRVAVVCSGDAGVYAMASIVEELAPAVAPGVDVEVVPGVTAALAAAAVLGAPLGHDHAVISLSDLLTPWDVIEQRILAAAEADFVIVFYNPRSRGRDWQLGAAFEILGRYRSATTPVGIVTDAGRPGERVSITSLAAVDPASVGMTTCVIVGSSLTTVAAGRMVTPRGYKA